jgi:hypothetical protein
MIVGGAALVIGYLLLWAALPAALRYQSDFTLPYANAALLASNRALIYSQPSEAEEIAAHGGSPQSGIASDWLPTAIVTMVPLTALPLVPAMVLWGGLQIILLAAAVWLATQRALIRWARADRLAVGCIAFAGIGTFQLLREGQWDALPALGIAVAYVAWRRSRGTLAATALAVTAIWAKPQLGMGLAAFLLGRWISGELIAAGAAMLVLIGLDLAIVGSRVGSFLQAISVSAQLWPYSTMIGAPGLTSNFVSGRGLELILAIPLMTGALILCLCLGHWSRRRLDEPAAALPIAVTLSLFATPHGYVQDLVLLAPALIFLLSQAARRSRRVLWALLGTWALLNLTALFQTNGGRSTALGPELIPLALLMLSFVGWVAVRDQPLTSAAGAPDAPSLITVG